MKTDEMSKSDPGLITDEQGVARCFWQPSMPDYHDHEWGRPVADDRRLYEKICLEGFQAGMAWITILRKREAFRAAFDDFDFERVARYTERDVERLMGDAGIVRNRGKIVSAINNAKRARALADETVHCRPGSGAMSRRPRTAPRPWTWITGTAIRPRRRRRRCRAT